MAPTEDVALNSPTLQKSGWQRWQVDLLLIFVTLIWGGTFLVVQNSLKDVGPFTFVAFRFAIGALTTGPSFLEKAP